MADMTQRGALKKDDNGVAVGWTSKNITGTATNVVKTGAGVLHTLVINTPIATSVITIYDGVDTGGTKIATITIPATLLTEGPYGAAYDVAFSVGLTIVTATAASDITASFI